MNWTGVVGSEPFTSLMVVEHESHCVLRFFANNERDCGESSVAMLPSNTQMPAVCNDV